MQDMIDIFGEVHFTRGKVNSGTLFVQTGRTDIIGLFLSILSDYRSDAVYVPKQLFESSDAAKAALKDRESAVPPPVVPLELPESVRQYVISEAKYYYGDGTIRREEIFRDGKLMIRRGYNPRGELVEETFHDPKAHLHRDAQPVS